MNRSYDRWGNVLSVSDARYAGWVTRYAYNANNQLVTQLQPDGNGNANAAKTSILYDVLGRQVAVIDANGNMNRQEWDAAGNLVAERHADGGDITYRYDVFGNKVQAVARANASPTGSYTTDYGYDRMNRLTTTTYAAVDASHYNAGQLHVDQRRSADSPDGDEHLGRSGHAAPRVHAYIGFTQPHPTAPCARHYFPHSSDLFNRNQFLRVNPRLGSLPSSCAHLYHCHL